MAHLLDFYGFFCSLSTVRSHLKEQTCPSVCGGSLQLGYYSLWQWWFWGFLSFSPYTCSTLLAPSCGRILKHFCLVWDPKMSQSWRFIGKTDAEAEAAIVWHLIRRTDSLEKTLWLHGDCSHEIKRRLLLGRKAVTNLDSVLKSRDITLPTKVCLVKAMIFPVVMYGCES